jgi:hypothetical protein
VDWKAWLRTLDRKRRQLALLVRPGRARLGGRGHLGGRGRSDGDAQNGKPSDAPGPQQRPGHEDRRYLALVTRVSFEMDGIVMGEHELADALGRSPARRRCRSRQAQRLRNHVAILCRVGSLSRRGQPLEVGAVVRWYTSISCGLSSALLDAPTLTRLEWVARQINSPHLNLRPALEATAGL